MALDTLFDNEAGCAWRLFDEINRIPRPSGQEERIRGWVCKQAEVHGWPTSIDIAGNVVVHAPGKGQLADVPPLILQGHLDMVCEKNADVEHDFMTQSIQTEIADGWVKAIGTTLGADNGVAVAMALAVASEDLENRMPLELLFTIEEEIGLNGALALDSSKLNGRMLLNIDSEEEGVFIIGCVGGMDLELQIHAESIPPVTHAVRCTISGLRGGHSGLNIHEGRGNAILAAGQILKRLDSSHMRLLSFHGGNKKNAIPREAGFIVSGCNAGDVESAADAVIAELSKSEPDATASVNTLSETFEHAIPLEVIDMLDRFPNGVIAMEADFPELVRTSNSLGVAELNGKTLKLLAHGRSSVADDLEQIYAEATALAELANAEVWRSGDYPGWRPHANSAILKHAVAVYQDVHGQQPKVEGIHAGLECGIIGDKLGTHELLSCGPTILNAHSPAEALEIESFERIYRFLKAFVSTPMEG